MREITKAMAKRKKKKGRPSLLDLQKRSLKQQKFEQDNENPNEFDWIGEEDDERKEKKHRPVLGFTAQQNNHYGYQFSSSSSPPNCVLANPHGSRPDQRRDNPDIARRTRPISAIQFGSDTMNEQNQKATGPVHCIHEAPPNPWKKSMEETGPTTLLPDKKLLVFILDRIQKKDTYGVFSEPVDSEELPDYHDLIEHPMDFSTIRKKLDDGVYLNLEQFEKDVFLVCSNAMQYNSPDSVYFRQARSMMELAKKDFENLRQESDDSDPPQPKVVRRGRPPGKLKKPLDTSPVEPRLGLESPSDAILATAGRNCTSSPNVYDLRRTTAFRYQPADVFVRPSHGSNADNWLADWENEFPASVVKAVQKHGKKQVTVDENKRDSYFQPMASMEDTSIFTTFAGERKQLMAVGLGSGHSYARSVAQFAADLGPVVWKVASKKFQAVLPVIVESDPMPGNGNLRDISQIVATSIDDNFLVIPDSAASTATRPGSWNAAESCPLHPQITSRASSVNPPAFLSVAGDCFDLNTALLPEVSGAGNLLGFGFNPGFRPPITACHDDQSWPRVVLHHQQDPLPPPFSDSSSSVVFSANPSSTCVSISCLQHPDLALQL